MYIFFSVLIIIVCVILILIVLVQNSKGGGLAAGFASSNQYMGVRKTADFLEKATWTLAGSLLVLCLLATITNPKGTKAPKSVIEEQINNTTEDPGKTINYDGLAAPDKGKDSKGTTKPDSSK